MRKIIILAVMLAAGQAVAQNRTYLGPDGEYLGSSVDGGSSRTYLDSRGEYRGTAMRLGNSTQYFDAEGRDLGQAIDTGGYER